MNQQTDNPYQAPATEVLSSDHKAFASAPRAVPMFNGVNWIGAGWNLFMRAPGPMILMLLVYMVINMIVGALPLVQFVSPLLGMLFMGGVFIALLRLDRTGSLKIEDLFAAFSSHLIPLILLGLLMLGVTILLVGLLFMLGLGTILGSSGQPSDGSIGFLLFLILLAMVAFFCLYFVMLLAVPQVVLNDQPVPTALSNALSAILKNILPFLLHSLLAALITLVAMIPLGLGLLVSIPVLFASLYVSYTDVFAAE